MPSRRAWQQTSSGWGLCLPIRLLKLLCNALQNSTRQPRTCASQQSLAQDTLLALPQQLSVFPSGGSVAGMDVRQTGEPGTGDGASASGSLSRPATPSDPHTSGPNTPTGALGHPEGGHPARGTSSVELYGIRGLQIPTRHSADAVNNASWGSAPNPGVCSTPGQLAVLHLACSDPPPTARCWHPGANQLWKWDPVPLLRARCSHMSCLEARTSRHYLHGSRLPAADAHAGLSFHPFEQEAARGGAGQASWAGDLALAGGQGLSPKTPPSSQAAYLAGLASLQVSLQLRPVAPSAQACIICLLLRICVSEADVSPDL